MNIRKENIGSGRIFNKLKRIFSEDQKDFGKCDW